MHTAGLPSPTPAQTLIPEWLTFHLPHSGTPNPRHTTLWNLYNQCPPSPLTKQGLYLITLKEIVYTCWFPFFLSYSSISQSFPIQRPPPTPPNSFCCGGHDFRSQNPLIFSHVPMNSRHIWDFHFVHRAQPSSDLYLCVCRLHRTLSPRPHHSLRQPHTFLLGLAHLTL